MEKHINNGRVRFLCAGALSLTQFLPGAIGQGLPSTYSGPRVAISVSPATVSLTASSPPQQFSAHVFGDSRPNIVWSISPQAGSISATGLYTPPTTIATQLTVIVTASTASPPKSIKSGTATITLRPATKSTFQLSEFFGVGWPEQPIEFRYDGGQPPATTRMLGPDGTEVPFQWVSSCSDSSATKGCIVVRSRLPANANYTWTLQSGAAPTVTPVHAVQLAQVGSNWEITNGLTGVRLIAADSNPSPWNLAPIQGIGLPDGTWTGAGAAPNFLYFEGGKGGNIGGAIKTKMALATGYTVAVTDSGPMKVVLKATYTFNRPQYSYGSVLIDSAGQGHYTVILTMYANSKSIVVDEDSDMQFSYYLPVYTQLMPDLSRYRGFDSLDINGANNPACGYEDVLTLSGATNVNPIVITGPVTFSNGQRVLWNGQRVLIAGVQGNAAANGTFFAKTNGYPADQFALYQDANLSIPIAGTGPYTSGGTIKPAYRGQYITAATGQPTGDAFLDLTYSADRPASYVCSSVLYRKLMVDYPPASHAAGWYSALYNSTAGANSPVVGFYAG